MTTTAVFLNGTVGVGKSTVADALGAALRAERIPHAVIDLDELRRGWPSPPGDRFNTTIELANLRSVAANYIAAGARMLVLAGVLEETAMVERYREALGASVSLTVVRLTLEPAEAERRLRRRHENDPDGLAWHLNRFAELDGIIDAARFSVATFDTTADSPALVAERILRTVKDAG
ncbi:AAA family ATPase [Leifsonia sp. NPDC058230]|uniref:AAA family ATPase n=1 Tax=Leifsonia sp. NPDC058230 TaxID=3346391 RepID=UPI0036D78BDE